MLAVLRFSFSKELKFVRARLGKPYNSALGMSFRCLGLHRSRRSLVSSGLTMQVNTFDVLGTSLPFSSTRRPKSRSYGHTCTFPSPENRRTAVKVEVDGPLLCSDQRMEEETARPGKLGNLEFGHSLSFL